MKIYTKTGDKGETSLYTGERVVKDNPIINAVGTVDECNCCIGLAIAALDSAEPFAEVRRQLESIQHSLFDVGAALATPRTRASNTKIDRTRFDSEATIKLEGWIDQMEANLPPLQTFILPGGHPAGAFLHLARSVCRRAERLAVSVQKQGDLSEAVLIYLNRLSDYLFVVSRYVNQLANRPETFWHAHT